jgi:O-antigen/teichoic acid export membrane protein
VIGMALTVRLRTASRSPAIAGVLLTGVAAGLSGVAAVLAAKWLGAEERGTYALLITSSGMALILLSFGISKTATAILPSDEHDLNVRQYFARVDRLIALALVAVVPLSAAAVHVFEGRARPTTIIVLASYTASALQAGLTRAGLHGWERHRLAYFADAVTALLLLAGASVVEYVGELTVVSLMLIGTASFVLPSAGLRFYVHLSAPRGTVGSPGIQLRELVRLSLPTLGLTFGSWAATRGDRLVLGLVSTNAEVGVYSAVATLAEVPWLVSATLATVLTARLAASREISLVRRYRRLAFVGTICAWAAIAPVAVWILAGFLGNEFSSGIPAFVVMFPAAVFLASGQIDLAACLAMGDRRVGGRVAIRTAMLMLPLVVLLGLRFGALGAAISSVITYAAWALWARARWNAIEANVEDQ